MIENQQGEQEIGNSETFETLNHKTPSQREEGRKVHSLVERMKLKTGCKVCVCVSVSRGVCV